ncbi:TonB-dependent receptor plug domain-containing protein [Piscinibacter defluvii]|uniref:TonB-dependent receptor plug domain-containing protein n=1 Tax=Piscinibacter defluvii TaxID=1796922 RepID=UPI000FDDD02F|nr:TonB-dependent receptor [Piscinibacter defluvii]
MLPVSLPGLVRPFLAAARRAVLAGSVAALLPPAAPAAEVDPAADELAAVLAQPVAGSSRLAAPAKVDQDAAEAPSLVYVRTGGEIRAQGYRTLAEVLESLPGVHLRQDRAYTYVGVRGVERPGDYSSRLLLLIDGARVNEAIYDSATAGREFPLDVGLIDRVEFIPGPGSALYGTNAVLGVVNIVTRGPSQLPGAAATFELGSLARRKFGATWGGDLGPTRVLLGIAAERARGHASLYFPGYDDPSSHHGWAIGRDGERHDKLFAKARWGGWSLTAVLSERLKDDPTGAYGVLFNERSDSLDRYGLADLSYAQRLNDAQEVHARLGLGVYAYRGFGLYAPAEAPVPGVTHADARWIAGELRHVWSGWRGHRLLLGLEFQHNTRQRLHAADLEPAPQVYTDITMRSVRYALFVNDEWQLAPRWRLNLGTRADRQVDGRTTASPRIAALWSAAPAWTLKLQRGSAFREPNASETGYQDSGQALGTTLRAEALRSSELTALWRPSAALDASLTWYRLDLRDSINFVDLPGGQQGYANTGSARARGVELEATWQVDRALRLRGSWARQHTRDLTTGAELSDAPRSLAKLMATLAGPWPGSTFGLNLLRVGERRTLTGARLEPYLRLNVQATLAPPGQPGSVALGLYNLADTHYADPAGPEHRDDTLAQDGRSVRLQFGWTF